MICTTVLVFVVIAHWYVSCQKSYYMYVGSYSWLPSCDFQASAHLDPPCLLPLLASHHAHIYAIPASAEPR